MTAWVGSTEEPVRGESWPVKRPAAIPQPDHRRPLNSAEPPPHASTSPQSRRDAPPTDQQRAEALRHAPDTTSRPTTVALAGPIPRPDLHRRLTPHPPGRGDFRLPAQQMGRIRRLPRPIHPRRSGRTSRQYLATPSPARTGHGRRKDHAHSRDGQQLISGPRDAGSSWRNSELGQLDAALQLAA